MTVFEQLFTSTQSIVAYYRTDFQHDEKEITAAPGVPFLHFAYECGTHLIMLHPAESPSWPAEGVEVPYLFGQADRHRILRGIRFYHLAVVHNHRNDGRWTYYDGTLLAEVTAEKARSIIDEYVRNTEVAWTAGTIASTAP